MGEFTPMMQHYLDTKEQYKDCILFYRLGDFYEMFFDDAKTVSRELELTLTGKACGMEERAPMCGVPFHAVDTYLTRLVAKGYKVAICEQVEDPKEAKGMVKREVVRIVTPGTNLDTGSLDETKNNYLMSVDFSQDTFGIATCDLTTGDFFVTEVDEAAKFLDEVSRYNPSELLVNDVFCMSGLKEEDLRERFHLAITTLANDYFVDEYATKVLCEHFHVKSLQGLGLADFHLGNTAAGALLSYLIDTQKSDLAHLTHITPYVCGNYMLMDSS
ncbi:MAG: DNA mismatch repair protein MutS, partial [Lachnospiraceae bacterium]|nr:DNA mismatch repair protein MutS [Lachnospiraceae bacterium]